MALGVGVAPRRRPTTPGSAPGAPLQAGWVVGHSARSQKTAGLSEPASPRRRAMALCRRRGPQARGAPARRSGCPGPSRPGLAGPALGWAQPYGLAPGCATRSPGVAGSVGDGLCQRHVGVPSDERRPRGDPSRPWPIPPGPRERRGGGQSGGRGGDRAAWGGPRWRAGGRASASPPHAPKPPGQLPPATAGPSQSGPAPAVGSGAGAPQAARCPPGALG
jgi:hypothetical protein